jgi:photosystem II stability/assembly factor-like uncharacterized protein
MKKTIKLTICSLSILMFSACSLTGNTATSTPTAATAKKTANFIKTLDGGKNWENKITIDDKSNIGNVNVLSMAVNANNGDNVYIGAESEGLFTTTTGGDKWEKLPISVSKIYGLALDKSNSQVIYASGVLNKRAKIFRSGNGGKDWVEIYTEPAGDSIISSLEISAKDPKVLYCGTSLGVILKTIDGGQTWRSIFKASGPIVSISFDSINDNALYFGVFQGTVLRTMDGGNTVEDLSKLKADKAGEGTVFNKKAYSLAADPKNSGVIYVGTDTGMVKGTDYGNSFVEIKILESSKKFPIRAIAINPFNSAEILYSNSGVIYRSSDGGITWFTFQLNSANSVSAMKYNPLNPNIIYAGLRKI